MIKACIVVNALPKYRFFLYNKLIVEHNLDLKIYCHSGEVAGLENFIGNLDSNVVIVPYASMKGERVVFSFLPFFKILREYDLFVVEGNPRYVSHFILATIARLLQKKVVLWTMVHSYRNNSFSKLVRLVWTSMFNKILVYTPCEKKELERFWLISKSRPMIVSIGNGVNYQEICKYSKESIINWGKFKRSSENIPVFLSIGRIVPKNQFGRILEGLSALRLKGFEFEFVLVGSGPEEKEIKEKADEFDLGDRTHFLGSIYSEKELSSVFLSADCFLAFTGVGLSILHAMAYALPIITHGNRRTHGPEFCAFNHKKGGYLFKENSVSDFTCTVEQFCIDFKLNKDSLNKMGLYNSNVVSRDYNTKAMAVNFIKIIDA